MGDDDNDYDGVFPDMMHTSQANNLFVGNGFQGHPNVPSMAHSLPTLPGIDALPWDLPNSLAVDGTGFHPGSFAAQQQAAQPQQHGTQAAFPSLSSFMANQPPHGTVPLSAFVLEPIAPASMAGPSSVGLTQPGVRQASTASAATATGASTAQMHQQTDADEHEA